MFAFALLSACEAVAQATPACHVLCAPEFKVEPTVTFTNLFGSPRIVCISVVRAAGAQGIQNGSISCVALVLAVPGGTRAILAENVLAAWHDLEVASGNDAIASHSAIRKTAKLMGQFLPGRTS